MTFVGVVTTLIVLSLAIAALRQRVPLGGVIALILYTLAPFALWWYVSWRLPHRPCPLIALAPGAALFAIGVELLQVVTVVWFPHYLESKSEVYGAIGIAIVLLLWAYLVGRVITLSVVLNAALWERFGTSTSAPTLPRRLSTRIPFVDRALGRIWSVLFNSDAREPGSDREGHHQLPQ
jgi:uncharacterized BrkB/YihY/UPF0761 family membrane protein